MTLLATSPPAAARSTDPDEPPPRSPRVGRLVALLVVTGLLAGCVAASAQTRLPGGGIEPEPPPDPPAAGPAAADPVDEEDAGPVPAPTDDARAVNPPGTGRTGPERSDDPTGSEGSDRSTGTTVAHATGSTVVARSAPSPDAEPVERFANPTAQGGPLVFQAVGPEVDGWIEVLLPVRPNGTTGWVPVEELDLTVNPYRILVDVDRFELTIHRLDQLVLRTPVGIGEGDTPTPIGDFYLMELLKPTDPGGPYGPYAYGLSGHSTALESFNGGAGVIGIHGTNRPELIGNRVSHGCIRIANDTITEMAGFLPLGTPVSIVAHSGAAAELVGSSPF